MDEEDVEAALLLYARAAAAHPTNTWTWLGSARALFKLGREDEAFRTLAEVRKRLGPHPEIASLEIELLRSKRNWSRAQAILQEALSQISASKFLAMDAQRADRSFDR